MTGKRLHRNKYIEIADYIEERINNGTYQDGAPLPPIRELAKYFAVSPQTVNKATTSLASKGILETRQGSGCVVSRGIKVAPAGKIAMLIDQNRSVQLKKLDLPENYHSKDIYLAYSIKMGDRNFPPVFIDYYSKAETISEDEKKELLKYSGFIVQGTLPECYIKFFAENRKPAVFINRTVPKYADGLFGAVLISEAKILDAFNYFASLGHSKILLAYPEFWKETPIQEHRLAHAEKAAEQTFQDDLYEIEHFCYVRKSKESLLKFKELHAAGFKAAFCFNDIAALDIYLFAHESALGIPSQFSVIGFDDIFAGRVAIPALTTIRVDRNLLVEKAFKIVDRLITLTGNKILVEHLETELLIRKSAYICS